ncbi:recombinase XerC [Candidatus Woesearchaeota archaeon CG10_big_fil_rev_8_21_14_0_10_34_12]|nr:MAG: recombinase XerC [Candidatus Woesearchaeota archaeon CG10_big_fil_rev_8_21_14_0_10_34_12]
MGVSEAIEKEASRRRFSDKTIKTYQKCVERFFLWCKKEPKYVTKKDVHEFLEKMSERGKSGNTINIYLNALKFYFEEILRRNFRVDIRYSKIPKNLPIILTKEEVKKLIDNTKNHKHKIMVALLYSAGLRASELLNLKLKDLNFKEKYGFVRQGKGRKDRIFIIAEKLERVLLQLSVGRNKEEFLFINNKNKVYSISSLQKIVEKAGKLAGIQKKIHPHTLRHSFATHLIENSCSVSEVQTLLGHKSPEATMIYLHTAAPNMIKIKSPFDRL